MNPRMEGEQAGGEEGLEAGQEEELEQRGSQRPSFASVAKERQPARSQA